MGSCRSLTLFDMWDGCWVLRGACFPAARTRRSPTVRVTNSGWETCETWCGDYGLVECEQHSHCRDVFPEGFNIVRNPPKTSARRKAEDGEESEDGALGGNDHRPRIYPRWTFIKLMEGEKMINGGEDWDGRWGGAYLLPNRDVRMNDKLTTNVRDVKYMWTLDYCGGGPGGAAMWCLSEVVSYVGLLQGARGWLKKNTRGFEICAPQTVLSDVVLPLVQNELTEHGWKKYWTAGGEQETQGWKEGTQKDYNFFWRSCCHL